MLLKAGMSVKQAVCYNILSSILAFVGMIIGRFLGDLPNLTPWIFMATAGVFLYVALVDMIPELNSGHSHPYTSEEHHESKVTYSYYQTYHVTLAYAASSYCSFPYTYRVPLLYYHQRRAQWGKILYEVKLDYFRTPIYYSY